MMPKTLRKYYSKRTHQARLEQLINEVNSHPHRNELITIMQGQQVDDKFGHFCSSLAYCDEIAESFHHAKY